MQSCKSKWFFCAFIMAKHICNKRSGLLLQCSARGGARIRFRVPASSSVPVCTVARYLYLHSYRYLLGNAETVGQHFSSSPMEPYDEGRTLQGLPARRVSKA